MLHGFYSSLFHRRVREPVHRLRPAFGSGGGRSRVALPVGRHLRDHLRAVAPPLPELLLGGLALVSVAWSDAPALTFRRGIALVGTCLIALYIAARYRLREQLRLLVWVCGG